MTEDFGLVNYDSLTRCIEQLSFFLNDLGYNMISYTARVLRGVMKNCAYFSNTHVGHVSFFLCYSSSGTCFFPAKK